MKSAISIVICLLLLGIAYPMNDTDGVCGKGLFPIGPNAKSLVLLNGRADIMLTKSGTLVRRTYQIKNTGNSGTFTFGAIKCYNCVAEPKGDFLRIKDNEHLVNYSEHISFLRDNDTVVTRRDLSLKDTHKRLASLDGTIETLLWVSFQLQMRANTTKTIEVEYLEHLMSRVSRKQQWRPFISTHGKVLGWRFCPACRGEMQYRPEVHPNRVLYSERRIVGPNVRQARYGCRQPTNLEISELSS